MIVSFLDLRKRTRDILKALNRNESITLLYRGKPKAVMSPVSENAEKADRPLASDLPAFGMWADRDDLDDLESDVRELRKARHADI